MRVVLGRWIDSGAPGASWALYVHDGSTIDLPDLDGLPREEDVVLDLRSGVYWLLQAFDRGIHVRYYVLVDEYPMRARETLITGVSSDFLVEGRDVDQVRQAISGNVRVGGRTLRYPTSLIEAVCDRVTDGYHKCGVSAV